MKRKKAKKSFLVLQSKKKDVFLQTQNENFDDVLSLDRISRCSSGVEHFLGKEEVMSSNLINGSFFMNILKQK